MFREPEDYDFQDEVEKADFAVHVLRAALPQLTRRQLECAYLLAEGLTQEQAGDVLGIRQHVVSWHFAAHLKKIREIAKSYR